MRKNKSLLNCNTNVFYCKIHLIIQLFKLVLTKPVKYVIFMATATFLKSQRYDCQANLHVMFQGQKIFEIQIFYSRELGKDVCGVHSCKLTCICSFNHSTGISNARVLASCHYSLW